MEIKDLKLIPPSKRATAFFRNFIKEHDKGLKAIKTLAEIKKLVEKEFCRHPECCEFCAISNDCINQKIIEKINEVDNDICNANK